MRRARIIVNLLAIAVIIYSAITLRTRSRAQHRAPSPADPLAILDRRVAAVDFAGTSLTEAAEALGKAADVRIAVDPAAAELAGRVDASEISLGGITLEENLRRMISRFDGLSYIVERDRIRITTSSRAPAVARIYDVRDVSGKLSLDEQQHMKSLPPPSTMPIPAMGIFGGAAVPQSALVYRTPAQTIIEAMDQIHFLITDSVARDEWQENGGATGWIAEAGGFLIIVQTPAAHRQIAQLLAAIRRADKIQWQEEPPRGRK
ncbi:MAG TPA: hypothetical protein VH370_00965 [Humisphaera sp.]|jgi:hypothetical protein|nr:hypothetical protein [Humisphaera sp.]